MANLKKYELSAEDKKKLEDVAKKQVATRKNMSPEQIKRDSEIRRKEVSGPSVTREDER